MKKPLSFLPLLLIGLSMFAACSKAQFEAEQEPLAENNYTIPIEEALDYLKAYLETTENAGTKSSGDKRTISDVQKVYAQNLNTKSSAGDLDCEVLLYLVNFEDEQGFAVLAADERIPSSIIAIVDKGHLTANELYTAYNDEGRVIFPEYPTDGPGVFTDNQYPGESFMNPNTFSLYDAPSGDYSVGTFNPYSPSATTEDSALESLKDFLGRSIVDYSSGSIWAGDDDEDPKMIDLTDMVREVKTTTVDYDIIVAPLLSFAKYWHQESPFNDLYPEVRKYILLGNKRKAFAGCVPLAIGKIITYFETPSTWNYNGVTIDWQGLKADYTSASQSASALLRDISERCNSLYFYEGTFTFPSRAKALLESLGFTDVQYKKYDTETIKEALKDGNPLFVCSIPEGGFLNYDLFNSHGWNIDGYQIQTKTTTTAHYLNDECLDESSHSVQTTMVHCDFGWEGYMNGYFTSGVFDLDGNGIILDDESDYGTTDTNYKWYLRTITYSL